MTKKLLFLVAVLAITSVRSVNVVASGSDSVREVVSGDAQLYNLGKKVYFQKLVCSTCPMAKMKLTQKSADKLLKSKEMSNLSEREVEALGVYLHHRINP
jgi:hypothetical protein